jgi:hypothetical protein
MYYFLSNVRTDRFSVDNKYFWDPNKETVRYFFLVLLFAFFNWFVKFLNKATAPVLILLLILLL